VLDSELDEANQAERPQPLRRPHRRRFGIADQGRPADKWLADTVRWTWRIKVFMHLELELMNALRERAEEEAIRVFGAQPARPAARRPGRPARHHGPRPRHPHRLKVAVVDATGKLLDTATIYPHEPRRDWDGSLHTLAVLAPSTRST
jgi:uncharacterized protein